MQDELISFETAKLAKEKGFDWPVDEFYMAETGEFFEGGDFIEKVNHNEFPDVVSAPTQSLLQRWLREKLKIIVSVTPYAEGCKLYNNIEIDEPEESMWSVFIHSNRQAIYDHVDLPSYEAALEQGLPKALISI